MAGSAAAPQSDPPPPPNPLLTFGLMIANILGFVLAYEFVLVALETYGYSLTESSSNLIFGNAVPLGALVFALVRIQLQTIRNARILRPAGWLLLGILGGILGLYWLWAVDRWLRMGLMGKEGAGLSLSPGAIADFMLLFHGKGYWGWGAAWYYDRAAVQGTWLVVWWLLEAILVFLVPSMFAGLFLSRHPPCRRCGNWLYMNEGARRVQSSRADRVFTGMKNGDLSPLEEPDRPQKGDPFTVRIDFIPCESCVGTFYVNLLHDRKVLLWMHPIPASEAQKVFKPVRASKKK